jgi:SlyX protein
MTDLTDLQKRVDQLETHIAHQDQLIEELSDVAARQWTEIEALTERLDQLKSKFQDLEQGMDDPPGEEPPPPHY